MKTSRICLAIRKIPWSSLLSGLFFVVILALFLTGVSDTARTQQKEALVIAQKSLTRAAISCYSVEGRYPDNYLYLEKNYGVSIDEDRYAVHYEIFAENIMPTITVVEK